MMKRKYKIMLGLLVLLLGAGVYAYLLFSKENPDLTAKKPDYTMDAASLIAAFDKDAATATQQYLQKLVLVTGTISGIDTSGVITLGNPGEMSSVQCTMDNRHWVDYATLEEGQPISIKGRCTGHDSEEMLGEKMGTNVKLNFCVIEKQ